MDTTEILKVLTLDDATIDSILDKLVILNIDLVDVYAFAVQHKVSAALAARVLVVYGLLEAAEMNPLIDPRWDEQRVIQITHYTSTSGNPTWKATLDGRQVLYIRQENKQTWFDAGYAALADMAIGDVWDAGITVYTAPGEKNFLDCKQVMSGGLLAAPAKTDAASVEDELLHISYGVAEEARGWLKDGCYVLDTETTGLTSRDGVIQLAILDHTGTVLLNTLIKPTVAIGAKALEIHGITEDMVKDAPQIRDLKIGDQSLHAWLLEHEGSIVTYNAEFDSRLLSQSFFDPAFIEDVGFIFPHCAMTLYARQNGDWDERKQDYRWVSLANACDMEDLPLPDHSALGDATATLALIKTLARGTRLPF